MHCILVCSKKVNKLKDFTGVNTPSGSVGGACMGGALLCQVSDAACSSDDALLVHDAVLTLTLTLKRTRGHFLMCVYLSYLMSVM